MNVQEDKDFTLELYINKKKIQSEDQVSKKSNKVSFYEICQRVKRYFEQEWEAADSNFEKILLDHKRAIIGHEKEVAYFKDKIREYLRANHLLDSWKPIWYEDIVEGVYQELWGLAGLSEWFSEKYKDSSSAKIIGDRIYFLIKGKTVLMPQRIHYNRRRQLIKALLLNTPQKRLGDQYHEVYMLDGSRITIFSGDLVKGGQETLVFRKFFVKDYTFEKQVQLKTIPIEAVPFFKSMIQLGFNVAFTGAVRTAKTTFLSTWQSYEQPDLEGVMVETDPEIPLHQLMPKAPIVQLIADGEALEGLTKNILRSDADYVIMAEARDGIALNIAVKAANKGTRRVKITFHTTDPLDFCFDVAEEIFRVYGGSLYSTMTKVAKSFQYIFHFIQLQDKSQKRLKAIYSLDCQNQKIHMHPICHYVFEKDAWQWQYHISDQVDTIAREENDAAYKVFLKELNHLSHLHPMDKSPDIVTFEHLKGQQDNG